MTDYSRINWTKCPELPLLKHGDTRPNLWTRLTAGWNVPCNCVLIADQLDGWRMVKLSIGWLLTGNVLVGIEELQSVIEATRIVDAFIEEQTKPKMPTVKAPDGYEWIRSNSYEYPLLHSTSRTIPRMYASPKDDDELAALQACCDAYREQTGTQPTKREMFESNETFVLNGECFKVTCRECTLHPLIGPRGSIEVKLNAYRKHKDES